MQVQLKFEAVFFQFSIIHFSSIDIPLSHDNYYICCMKFIYKLYFLKNI